METIETLDPCIFRKLIVTVGELPTSFVDSMSYYECIAWLVGYIKNNVIPTVNNHAEAIAEIQRWIETLDLQDEVDHKLDEMYESGELAELIADYATSKVNYYHITSTTSESDMLSAFADQHSKVIEFDNGLYEIENNIILSSNTIVNLNGAELKNKTSTPMIFGYALNSEYTGYDGISNVVFNNGTLNICTALMHNTNIKYNNIHFGSDIITHAVQMAGCKNIEFNSCTFNGLLNDDEHASSLELVQIENCSYAGQPWLVPDSPSYDNTSCENIKFDDCYFDEGDQVSTSMYIAIGTHSINSSNDVAGKNITIKNCYIKNPKYAGLTVCGFDNFTFENNTILCNRSVTDSIMALRYMGANNNSIIRDNKFIGGRNALYNTNAKLCTGLLFENNLVDTNYDYSIGVTIRCWNNVKIINNEFKNAKLYYVHVVSSGIADTHNDNIAILNNSFKTNALTGSNPKAIFLEDGSNIHISNNLFQASATAKYISVTGANASNYVIEKNNFDNPSSISVSLVEGSSIDYTQIYDDSVSAFFGANANYTSYTSQTPTIAFSKFNCLLLKIHKNSDASKIMVVPCFAFAFGKKLDEGRTYPLVYTDGTTVSTATFKINSDGTFDYSSTDSIVLRSITGLNLGISS